jgi:UDP-N-acetylmuramoyl-tripeptide--D-alanyl-D-alanine ligase
MKKAFKSIVVSILSWQLKRLHKKHQFKTIAVVGSIGKTSTKLAIARVLESSFRVRYQDGNYNDIVTAPLVFFGQKEPSLTNAVAWIKVFLKNEAEIKGQYPYDIVVVELGTDRPGQIAAFKRYIRADIGVVTALTPEHMENFAGLTAVAEEEMQISKFSSKLLINTDLCPIEYLQEYSGAFLSYGIKKDATYRTCDVKFTADSSQFKIQKDRQSLLQATHDSFSDLQLYSLLAATAVADLLDAKTEAVVAGYNNIKPVSGRMQRLAGIKGSVIIDDTYNASPDAVKAALNTLYRIQAPQKIALLGNMNELGTFSPSAHTEIGEYCDPLQVNLVVTLGTDANQYLSEAAEKRGCKVVRANSPQEAGKVIAENLQEGALILAKGSQNGVFAEEAVKLLLADPSDVSKLVRQSPEWLKIKGAQT